MDGEGYGGGALAGALVLGALAGLAVGVAVERRASAAALRRARDGWYAAGREHGAAFEGRAEFARGRGLGWDEGYRHAMQAWRETEARQKPLHQVWNDGFAAGRVDGRAAARPRTITRPDGSR